MTTQTIIVTGAAGFIGSHAAEALLRRGWRVVGIDNFCDFYPRTWKESNIRSIRAVGGDFQIEEADITDAPRIESIVRTTRPQAILHLAAMAGVRPSILNPARYMRVNVEGTTNLLEAAVKTGVAKLIFASSSSVYGNASHVPFAEDDPAIEPISPYAATKRAAELVCHACAQVHGLPVSCLRLFTVYGPRQRPDLAIHKFTHLIASGKPVPFFGDGSTSRDYTYVGDTVCGIVAAIERCERFRIYNLGGSNPITLKSLVGHIERALGMRAILDRKPAQAGDVERTFADLTRSGAELGYEPHIPIDQGILRFIEWFRSHRDAYPWPDE